MTKEIDYTMTFIAEGPRWLEYPRHFRDIAFMCDVKLEMEVDKGYILESIRMKVKTRDPKALLKFVRGMISLSEDVCMTRKLEAMYADLKEKIEGGSYFGDCRAKRYV
jgi:hypothetical protein